MPARSAAQIAALRGGASDSEDDLIGASVDRDIVSAGNENKRNTGRAVKNKATTASKPATKRKAPTKEPRQALKDRTNMQDENETGDIEGADDDETAKPVAKRAKTNASSKTSNTKKTRPAKRAPSPEPLSTIPESQPDPEEHEDVEQSIEIEDAKTTAAPASRLAQRPTSRATPATQAPLLPRPSARAGSAQAPYLPSRERSGSAGIGERRGGDPELRRQLNELSKSHENLKLKLESLQELGTRQAESNFEKLKRASDQKAKDANELVAALRKELAELRKSSASTSSETAAAFQKQIAGLTAANEKLTGERDGAKAQLAVAQNEAKSLEAKLTATRQQLSASAKEAKERESAAVAAATAAAAAAAPSSKSTAGARNAAAAAAAEATLKEKEAQMVQNLYSDLTGLVILGVKRKEGEDEFDCLQTGRNGTLHFHLSIANDPSTPHPKTPSGMSYEEAEFAYEPLLDDGRDRDLLALLPDYLTEDICFPRAHAQKFYGKVVESITRSVLVEDDGDGDGDE